MNTKSQQTTTNHNKIRLISFVVVALCLASCVGNNTNQTSGGIAPSTNDVLQSPQINITTNGLTSGLFSANTAQTGQSFTVTAALSGGDNVANQNITLDNLSPASSSIIFTNNSCNISSQNESCTITVTVESSTKPESYTLSVTNMTVGGITPTTNSISFNVQQWKFIFVTESTFNGDLTHGGGVTNESFANGIIAADTYCMRDPQSNFPPGAKYKAMIADGINRTVSPSMLDWVLEPGTSLISFLYNPEMPGEYYNVIATVTPEGIPGVSIGNPFFVLQPNPSWSNYVWTGLYSYGTYPSDQFCGTSWSSTNPFGSVGYPGLSTEQSATFWIAVADDAPCNTLNELYCVQQ